MIEVSQERFEDLVVQALDEIPDGLARRMDNVAVLVADRGTDPDLLGLYDGIPLTERDDYGGLAMPDRSRSTASRSWPCASPRTRSSSRCASR